MHVMNKLFCSVIVMAALVATPAAASDAIEFPTYPAPFSSTDDHFTGGAAFRCTILSGVSPREDGRLGTQFGDEWFMGNFRSFTFDASNGVLVAGNETAVWKILRQGDANWNLIAHVPSNDPMRNIMRMNVSRDPVTFIMTNFEGVYSGTCERVR